MAEQILIIDLGSQYTLVLARKVQELGIHFKILPPENVADWLKKNTPNGIILTGGDKSVHDKDAPKISPLLGDVPILGICYGMQLIAHVYDGMVSSDVAPKYGKQKISFYNGTTDLGFAHLFCGVESTEVWASHGDTVMQLPPKFVVDAIYEDGTIAAISNHEQKMYGIQFHPEVTHTKSGLQMLNNFVNGICHCTQDWNPKDVISGIQQEVREAVGDGKAVLALSGGVDSLTLARTINFLGDNLLGVLIDTGGLREGEIEQARSNAELVGVNLKVVEAGDLFTNALCGNFDAEEKRLIFRGLYKMVLEQEAGIFDPKAVLIQGTIAPDIIESGEAGKSAVIKSHHNIIKDWKVPALTPFRNLFKFEVRGLAKYFELNDIVDLKPFPGPGLYLRVVGGPPTKERVGIVRWADGLVTRILQEAHIFDKLSQLVVALIVVNTVGIKGDHRAYGPAIVVRTVATDDYMTAEGYQIPSKVREKITTVLCEHPTICRVWYDEGHKPPATIEFE